MTLIALDCVRKRNRAYFLVKQAFFQVFEWWVGRDSNPGPTA